MAQALEGRKADVERAAEALRRSEQEFRALIENAQDAITVLDAQGRIRYQSPASERILGYRPEELIGRSVTEFIHPEDLDALRQAAAEAQARPGDPTTHEFRVRHMDGTWRVLEGIGQDLLADPMLRGVIVNARDVTARRQAEETLRARDEHIRQLQKLEAVGQLAGGVAHDFNNLLTVITGRSQLLLDSSTLAAPIRKNIEQIRKTAERAAALTRQLLAFSRKQILAPKVLSLNTVVPDLTAMLQRLIGEDIDLVFRPDTGLGRVKADPGQLEQVIMNLVVNARDAMPEGGRITVETANVELSEAYARQHIGVQAGSYVMLAVSDTGIGMDPATQAKIFEPFFTTKAPGKGTGLGLSTVYGIVKQSGGNVWVYSEPGDGTTFKVYLPRVEDAEEGAELAPSRPGGGTETVLLVEDEDELRTLAREILEGYGYTVFEAGQPTDALLVGDRHTGPIDLLVTDVVLPEMSGRRLAERLRPLRPEMKVLYTSGYTDNAIVHHGRLDPGTPFIQKPFTPDGLARKVREVLDSGELA
jgi:PAS domain S-box-containing protein